MAGAFLYDDKVAAATLSAPGSTTVTTLPLSYLTDPQPRLRARLMGSAASVLVDFGADTAIEAAALISTTLGSSATVRWRLGAGEGLIEATPAFDVRLTDLVPVYPAGWTYTRASAGWYFDSNGVLQQAASNALRFDCDPVTRLLKGLLLEEARTNSIRNPRAEGLVAGSPGTLPTNWAGVTNTGLTRTISAVGTENGIPYFEVRYNGTTSNGAACTLYFESTTGVAALTGQTWTMSSYIKIVGGSTANFASIAYQLLELDNVPTTLVTDSGSAMTLSSAPLGQSRQTYTVTTSGGGTMTNLRPQLRLTPTGGGVAIDITLRIGCPQLERGGVASSPILPTAGVPAATTRAADVTSVTGLTIGQAYTLLVQAQVRGDTGTTLVPAGIGDAVGFNDASYMTIDSSGTGTGIALSGGVNAGPACTVAASVGAQTIMVLAADGAGVSYARAGTLRTNVATWSVPAALDRVALGGASWGTVGQAIGVGWYQRLALYTSRLLDTQVTALSSTGSSLVSGALVYDSGVVTAATGDDAGGNVILLRPAAVTGRYLQVDVTNPSATAIDLGRLVAGRVWRPSRAHGYGVQEGRVILDRRDRNPLTGAEFPVAAVANPRTARFTLPLLKSAEIIGDHRTMLRQLGAAGDALWIPDTALSQAEINNRSIWGAIATAGDVAAATRDSAYGFQRSFQLIERV